MRLVLPAIAWVLVATSAAIAQFADLDHPSTIAEHTAARITCSSTADDVRFEVFELVPVRNRFGRIVEIQGAPATFIDFSTADIHQWSFTGPPGRYLLRIDCVDFDERTREIKTSTITIEPEILPDPDDPDVPPLPPDPDKIPEDRFGNLARSVAGWLSLVEGKARNKSTELGAVYLETAERLDTGKLIDFADANDEISEKVAKVLGSDAAAWSKWKTKAGEKFNEELGGGTRTDVIEAYRCVALGLGASLLETGASK